MKNPRIVNKVKMKKKWMQKVKVPILWTHDLPQVKTENDPKPPKVKAIEELTQADNENSSKAPAAQQTGRKRKRKRGGDRKTRRKNPRIPNQSLSIETSGVHEALISLGPDLIWCDEGHRIKNSQAGISVPQEHQNKFLGVSMGFRGIPNGVWDIKKPRGRRVVLTGYPLQNNLMEYWCMVDFVRPNYLGTKTEFSNMFERPITNGQCQDSTPSDVKLMRYRAHILHSLLEGFVQRRGHTILQQALSPKLEFIFLVRMSPIQRTLYREFMNSLQIQNLGS
uniref:Helicase ARIP4 n=1 Tax=Magallana gigas TaxID=29159 RepID=K1QUU1_MAGGI